MRLYFVLDTSVLLTLNSVSSLFFPLWDEGVHAHEWL